MTTVLVCFGLVVILLLALLWLPVSVRVQYQRKNGDDEGFLSVRWLFGLVHLSRRLTQMDATLTSSGPTIRVTHQTGQPNHSRGTSERGKEHHQLSAGEVWNFLLEWPRWVSVAEKAKPILLRLLRHVHVRRLHWAIKLGTGDAVTAGLGCGAAWAVTGSLLGALSHVCKFERIPDIKVEPDFHKARFDTSLECILRVRAGYAIHAGLGLIRVWRRRRTNGTSNPRAHANSNVEHT